MGGIWGQLGPPGRPRLKKEGLHDEKLIRLGGHFGTDGHLFGVIFLSVFWEPFLRVSFEILVPKGLPNGGLWGVIWRSF